jgi:diacylglycerol kinase family enzyme
LDGKAIETQSPLVIVSNIQLYGGRLAIGARACINDAKLDVCIFKGTGFFTFVQHALEALAKKHVNDPRVEYYQCREISLSGEQTLPVHMDGEPVTETPVTIRTLPVALNVIVPQNAPVNLFE